MSQDIIQTPVEDESVIDESSVADSSKTSIKKKLQQGYSTSKEKKSRGASAAKLVGRDIVDNDDKVKDAEMNAKTSNPVNVAAKVVKSMPMSAKVVVLGACLYNHNTKEMQKNLEKNMKIWKHNQSNQSASRGDTFTSTYQRIMAQYELERLEKKRAKIEKRVANFKQLHGVLNRAISGIQRGTQVMAQKQTTDAFFGDTSGIDRRSMLASSMGSVNNMSSTHELEV